jgi:hypothetical protein
MSSAIWVHRRTVDGEKGRRPTTHTRELIGILNLISLGLREGGCTMKMRRIMAAAGITTGCLFGGTIGAITLSTPAGAQQSPPIEECLGNNLGLNTPDCLLIEQSSATDITVGAFFVTAPGGAAYGASVSCGDGAIAFDVAAGGGLGEGIPLSLCDL